jgi:prevent-host-death family protein
LCPEAVVSTTPLTETLNITTARSQLSELVNRVFSRETRVIIQKSGIPVAAIVSAEDAARLEEFERQRGEDFAFFEAIQAKFADVPVDEHEREVARAVRQARSRRAGTRATSGSSRRA